MADSILYQSVSFSVEDVNRLELLTDQVAALATAANNAEKTSPRNKTVASLATTVRMVQVNMDAFFDCVSSRVTLASDVPMRPAVRVFEGPVVRSFRARACQGTATE